MGAANVARGPCPVVDGHIDLVPHRVSGDRVRSYSRRDITIALWNLRFISSGIPDAELGSARSSRSIVRSLFAPRALQPISAPIVDEPWPLRQLVLGVGTIHLPRHADQLRGLLPVNA